MSERGLIRYRIDLDYGPEQDGPPWCGVTAFDVDDAVRLIREVLFDGEPLPTIKNVVEDVDVSSIGDWPTDPPRYAPPIWRGIWYPPPN